MNVTSLNTLFRWRAEKSRAHVALMIKSPGGWQPVTWQEYKSLALLAAASLLRAGVKSGDRVAIAAHNGLPWVVMDMALLHIGAVSVIIPPGVPHAETTAIIRESKPRMVLLGAADELPLVQGIASVKEVVALDEHHPATSGVLSWSNFLARGQGYDEKTICDIADLVSGDDLASIVYTHGTTGDMSGVMITHYNLLCELMGLQEIIGCTEDDLTLLVLPTAHIFGRLIQLLGLYSGVRLALGGPPSHLIDDLQAVRPDFLGGVPKTFDALQGHIAVKLARQDRGRRILNEWALTIGQNLAAANRRGETLSHAQTLAYKLADKLLFQKIRDMVGGRLKLGVCSGAPLDREVAQWFSNIGITILEAYGMTETSGAITMNRKNDLRFGTVGKPLSQAEIRLADDGEILVRGPMVAKGYLGPGTAHRSCADAQGWLHTGDVGERDEAGFLKITDRLHDLIVSASGKTTAPQKIEARFRDDPYINRLMVHGEGENYLVALVTLNETAVSAWARQRGLSANSSGELCVHPEVRRLVQERIDQRNQELGPYETIRAFAILPTQFSVAGGELTITDRLQRRLVAKKYADQVGVLYGREPGMRKRQLTATKRARD